MAENTGLWYGHSIATVWILPVSPIVPPYISHIYATYKPYLNRCGLSPAYLLAACLVCYGYCTAKQQGDKLPAALKTGLLLAEHGYFAHVDRVGIIHRMQNPYADIAYRWRLGDEVKFHRVVTVIAPDSSG